MTDSGECLLQRSVLHSVDPDFRALVCAGGDGQEEAIEILFSFAEVSGGACAQRGGNFCQEPILVGLVLLEDVDEALAASHVNAFSSGIEVQIVGVLHAGKRGNHAAGVGVNNGEAGRFAKSDEEE